MTAKKIRVVYKEPGKEAEIKTIPYDLDKFQQMVEGYIETVTIPGDMRSPFEKTVIIICDEEGKLKHAAANILLMGDMIRGPVVFVGENKAGDDFGSLTEKDACMICEICKQVSVDRIPDIGGRTNGRYN